MAAKKKSILEKRLSESEARLKSALERLTKASKSFAAKTSRQSGLEKELESLTAKFKVLTAERDEGATLVGQLQDQLKSLQDQAAEQAAETSKERVADSTAIKTAIRDSLDATVGRLEALIAGRLKEAG